MSASASVPSRALGHGLIVSAQGFGAMGLSSTYGAADREESIGTLHAALDAGVTLIDTADIYGNGDNERLVGEVLRTRRSEVVLATKVGFLPEPDADGLRVDGSPDHVRAAVERSLERLGVDRIDLYYYHRVDPRIPIEVTVEAFAGLRDEGIIDHVGLSEVTAGELERAASIAPISAVQSEWSVWSRDIEDRVVPTAARIGAGVVAYSPLGRGFLAGPVALAAGDNRRNFPRFDAEHRAANEVIARGVRAVADRVGASPAQVALAWLDVRAAELGATVVPIPGTRRAARVRENLAAVDVLLGAADLAELNALAAAVRGDRARDALSISQGRERAAVTG
ncbi:aldo/keto reductase [Microbacterium sp. 179-B 1A2 NHS]|uniref:aldo/keto reductase n=1 Tax=Microbacterium sp. 179-B 1A2 NHS TaxID=3142383 RepID=UPI00399FC231